MLAAMPFEQLQMFMKIVPIVAACASAFACAYMFVGLRRLPQSIRNMLLVRQLQYLFVADIIYSIPEIIMRIVTLCAAAGLFRNVDSEFQATPFCVVRDAMENFGIMASLLSESHIAFSFLALICKSTGALGVLTCCLPFVWLLAASLALVSSFSPAWFSGKGCVRERSLVKSGIFAGTLLVSVICYVFSSWRACKGGGALRRSVWTRTGAYMLVTILDTGPIIFYYSVMSPQLTFFIVARTLFNFNGLLNVALYAVHCRDARKIRMKRQNTEIGLQRPGREHHFHVTFDGHDTVLAVPYSEGERASRAHDCHHADTASTATQVAYLAEGVLSFEDDLLSVERRAAAAALMWPSHEASSAPHSPPATSTVGGQVEVRSYAEA